MKHKKLAVVAMLALSFNANAEFFSGNKLLSLTTSSSEIDLALGFGYIAGVFDLGMGTTHCAPDTVTLKQVADMTLKLLRDVPEQREKSADQFVTAAISSVWPCKKSSAPATRI